MSYWPTEKAYALCDGAPIISIRSAILQVLSSAEQELTIKAIEQGVAALVPKPFDSTVEDEVQSMLEWGMIIRCAKDYRTLNLSPLGQALGKAKPDRLNAMLATVVQAIRAEAQAQSAKWKAESNKRSAIKAYNQACREILIRKIISKRLGWCETGRHLTTEKKLKVLETSGRRWAGSEYYERIEDFESKHTVCEPCIYNIQFSVSDGKTGSQSRLVQVQIRQSWIESVRKWWSPISYVKDFLEQNQIPPEIHN